MPPEIVPFSKIDDFGVIHLARKYPWINLWNPASVSSCLFILWHLLDPTNCLEIANFNLLDY